MALTQQQISYASDFGARVQKLRIAGKNDAEILMAMESQLPRFCELMDAMTAADFDVLGAKFLGFFHYAKILERVASQIASRDPKFAA
jgi:hypothetical protein